MAVECKRGCGFRKVGGLYLCSDGPGEACHKLPFPLDICPTCKHGIKQSRGWTWVETTLLQPACNFEDTLKSSADLLHCSRCAICTPDRLDSPKKIGQMGLLWIGEVFYKSVNDFTLEASRLGVSRRISAVPRGFKLGQTWVLLAHAKAVTKFEKEDPENGESILKPVNRPGIFRAIQPQRLELLITKTQATPEKLEELEKKGITPVVVPDDDPDHQGSVRDRKSKGNGKDQPGLLIDPVQGEATA